MHAGGKKTTVWRGEKASWLDFCWIGTASENQKMSWLDFEPREKIENDRACDI